MKKSLTWHEECLSNSEVSLVKEESRLRVQTKYVMELRESVEFRKFQIGIAKQRNLKEYDPDKFLVKRV